MYTLHCASVFDSMELIYEAFGGRSLVSDVDLYCCMYINGVQV